MAGPARSALEPKPESPAAILHPPNMRRVQRCPVSAEPHQIGSSPLPAASSDEPGRITRDHRTADSGGDKRMYPPAKGGRHERS